MKAVHHAMTVMRLTRGERAAFVLLSVALGLWGFSIGMDMTGP